MERFYQTAGAVLLAVILSLVLKKQSGEFGLMLSLCICCLVAGVAVVSLKPVIDYLQRLQKIGSLNREMLQILLKVVGVSVTAEIASLVCEDSGNSAMGKSLQILAAAVILYLSLPMLNMLLELVEEILGKV